MRTPALAVLFLCAAVAPLAAQQSQVAKPEPPPEQQSLPDTTPLAITVMPAPVAKGKVPQFVTITLTNTTDHAVRFPQPTIGCDDKQAGSVLLVVTPRAENVTGCATGHADGLAWTTLEPGETANYGEFLTPLLPKGSAAVEVRGLYTPAHLDAATEEALYRDSITCPKDTLTSAPATILREAQ
jgi:hypothetical protein